MSYWIKRWETLDGETITFDLAGQDEEIQVPARLIPLPGGRAFDPHGESQAPRGVERVAVDALAVGNAAARRATEDALRETIGKRGYLIRVAEDDASEHRLPARLLEMPLARSPQRLKNIIQPRPAFETRPPWQGQERTVTVTQNIASLTSIIVNVPNDGSAPVTDVEISLETDGDALDLVEITDSSHSDWGWEFASLPDGRALIVDTGALSVKVWDLVVVPPTETDAYSSFSFKSTHNIEPWARLRASETTMIQFRLTPATAGGTDITITITYREAWQ